MLADAKTRSNTEKVIPMKRVGLPVELANAIAVSGQRRGCRYVTGASLAVDGGRGSTCTRCSTDEPGQPTALLERIDRLESLDAIRQLAGKYALALDMRDMDAMANCFAPDVRVGRDKSGRAHLKAWLDETMRKQFHGTSHHLGQHIIEFSDADHATGVVYSKNEHETGPGG